MSKNKILIAPSILSADPLHFGQELASVEAAGADWHHIDVMDGHFVPNLTFGLPLIESLKKKVKLPLDVHIMVSNPDRVALDYVKAGADILVFHVEAATHSHRLCEAVRQQGAKVGIALNPGTPLESVYPLLPHLDVVMLMSVNPGFGGQKFIEQTVDRILKLKSHLQEKALDQNVLIEVDGGINLEIGRKVVSAGANVLVAGTYIYKSQNRQEAIAALKK